jgi:hypothetical protein
MTGEAVHIPVRSRAFEFLDTFLGRFWQKTSEIEGGNLFKKHQFFLRGQLFYCVKGGGQWSTLPPSSEVQTKSIEENRTGLYTFSQLHSHLIKPLNLLLSQAA